jgi:enoyl-CoA hydratase/carnithine racemase
MAYTTLTIEKTGNVATLTLNRPERMNSFDSTMRGELSRAWTQLADDEDVWAIVVTGAGEKAFCTGMDLREPPEQARRKVVGEEDGRVRITAMDCNVGKPVITAVNGVCAGGGLAFVADGDVTLASSTAYFTDARTGAGQVSIHGTLRLARKIPIEALFRLVMLGRAERVAAARAYEIGLVTEVCEPGDLMARAMEIAQAIASNSPGAVFHSRYAIWQSLNMGLDSALEMGWDVVTEFAHQSEDAAEGARAFVEKRAPEWKYAAPPGRKADKADD